MGVPAPGAVAATVAVTVAAWPNTVATGADSVVPVLACDTTTVRADAVVLVA